MSSTFVVIVYDGDTEEPFVLHGKGHKSERAAKIAITKDKGYCEDLGYTTPNYKITRVITND
jgi:hypothetical protein